MLSGGERKKKVKVQFLERLFCTFFGFYFQWFFHINKKSEGLWKGCLVEDFVWGGFVG